MRSAYSDRVSRLNRARLVVGLGIAFTWGCQSANVDSAPSEAGPESSHNVDGAGSEAGAESAQSSEATTDAEGANCLILASNYNQTCSVDSDCVGSAGAQGIPVQFGNYCTKMCLCGGGAINRVSAAQYVADVSKTPLFSGALGQALCLSCGQAGPTCCQAGRCVSGACPTEPSDSGATVMPEAGNVMCVFDAGVITCSASAANDGGG